MVTASPTYSLCHLSPVVSVSVRVEVLVCKHVCARECISVCTGKYTTCACVCVCTKGAGGGTCIGNVYTNQQTPPQPWDSGSHPSLSHIVYKVKETHRQTLLSSLIYSSDQLTHSSHTFHTLFPRKESGPLEKVSFLIQLIDEKKKILEHILF